MRQATAAPRGTLLRVALILGLGAGLAGCSEPLPPATPLDAPPARASANAQPDARGVITYADYQAAVAREGDTVASLAQRLGIPVPELAATNALPSDYRLRAGEIVLLPDSVPRPTQTASTSPDFGTAEVSTQPLGWSPEQASQAIESAGTAAAPSQNPFQNGEREPLIDPVRHRVEPGETAYSIARLYGVSVTALASWNGLGPDLAVREGQELLIPIVSGANQITGSLDTDPGEGTPVAPPPSAAAPLPENIAVGAVPASPGLGQYRTPPGGRLAPPVDGPVTTPYNRELGPDRSEGIGYSVPAGTPVRAAGPGEVALVSQSLGGLGTIVLIRHGDDLMTVYGRVSDVSVERGESVAQGQTIGVVADGADPGLHFEIRRGTDSVDPAAYLGG